MRFNPPPGWPTPPRGWAPPAGWQPDPRWPLPPPGWSFWTHEDQSDPLGAVSTVFGWIGRVIVAGILMIFAVLCFVFGASDVATGGDTAIAVVLGIAAIAYALWILSGRAYFLIFFG
ncbi:hypothetical protein [Nocardia inohanensis]|uniref:hypothetical protein n=1 Tax=Nocardia inohanensis TaxID=209246 RepID=UPI000A0591BF|nr:hypothetical protein [Nocardia inohanensis]